ncbi:FUSC family protein [Arthrobacter sp. D5-1]|uniref:FUSC family protein n=1 Tax=Arthrobacter sp. D5-1 TaxID=1477518 RepID=UPI001A97FD5E|nr:FUSC family protein [Arthrobacter sp. D5-1]QSZ50654.1 fusaric acid resistance protein [Arthrobacter sp. D5-1]
MKAVAEIFTMGPGNKDHHPALRCAVGVFVPLITLTLIGRLDLAVFASFGAFTGIYGRNEPHSIRFRSQLRAGGFMLFIILLATLIARFAQSTGLEGAAYSWLLTAATTIVAGVCSVVVAAWRLRPGGSLFHIFAFAAIASIAAQPPLWEAMLVSLLTTVFCLLIGMSSRVVKSHRTPWKRPPPIRHTEAERRAIWLEGGGYLIAAGLAGTIATLVGERLGFGHTYWAMVAAVVPLVGHSTRHRVSRGIQRIAGTVIGLVLLAGILLLNPAPWAMVLVIAACQFGAEMFIARQYLVAQVFVTPLALIATLLAAPVDPALLLRDRIIETVIGAAVGVAVVVAPAVWRRVRGGLSRA